ncbi:phytolongin Phyl1.1-like [Impatiens glandulifera]|uniref:phytolongin Phyl1.1-like n=1 Tax=Impatiens glandulifera TaxID=253017 RepID=UPI001FB19E29|nr:phytolongin Phyl1.1-like [Impatiens glandulifera]
MGSMQNTVFYCCVLKGDQIVYTYNSNGDPEIEKLASLCLERIPSFHKWYFQTMNHKTFGFLMEENYVYFTIADQGLGNSGVHSFLKHVMEEFRKASKKGTLRRTMSNVNSHALQEQLLPVVHRLIASLEKVSQNRTEWPTEALSSDNNANGRQNETAVSTKMPLLGRPGKHEKRKMKDHHHHMIGIRDIELEDRGIAIENSSGSTDSSSGQSGPLQKESSLRRSLSGGSQNARRKWCRQVRIILAIDAGLCLIMLVVWLVVCRGIQCLR